MRILHGTNSIMLVVYTKSHADKVVCASFLLQKKSESTKPTQTSILSTARREYWYSLPIHQAQTQTRILISRPPNPGRNTDIHCPPNKPSQIRKRIFITRPKNPDTKRNTHCQHFFILPVNELLQSKQRNSAYWTSCNSFNVWDSKPFSLCREHVKV